MLTQAVDAYLAIRRAAGFQLNETERILRDFVAFADAANDTFIRTPTVLAWAVKGRSPQAALTHERPGRTIAGCRCHFRGWKQAPGRG